MKEKNKSRSLSCCMCMKKRCKSKPSLVVLIINNDDGNDVPYSERAITDTPYTVFAFKFINSISVSVVLISWKNKQIKVHLSLIRSQN